MDQNKKLRASIIERAKAEYEELLVGIKKLTVEEVRLKAYEIVMKEEFLIMLEHGDLKEAETLQVLNRLEDPLSTLYLEWLEQEHNLTDDLRITLEMVVNGYADDLDTNNDDENGGEKEKR